MPWARALVDIPAGDVGRRAMTASRGLEQRFRSLVDHIPAAVYGVDLDGLVVSWNPAAVAMFGWSEAEAVGPLLPFVPADQLGESAQLRSDAAAGRRLDRLAVTRRRRDGSAIELSVSTAPVFDEAGTVVGIIAISFEVTELKRAVTELADRRRSEHQLAAIVSASGDAIISVSLDGGLTSWNAGAEAMFGFEAAGLSVSVNLSGRQFTQQDLTAVVTNILEDTGLEPARLILEITESVLLGDAGTTLLALKALGVGLSIDDFGTGYSSLSYLKRFPVDILKIDKSFVDGLGNHQSDAAIVALAHGLGLTTIAEGVETATQLEVLTALGCDKVQGYFFSQPQPGYALTRHLLTDQPDCAPAPPHKPARSAR